MKQKFAAYLRFPYHGISPFLFLQYLLLKMFPRSSFPKIHIIPFVMKYFNLNTEEEFRVRYYVSRIGFDDIWSSKDRTTPDSAAAFYNEHDADLWRQAYLSKFRYTYKKKTLLAYHIAKKLGATHVLDYGCGAGVVAQYLKQKGFVVDVADVP